MARAASGRWAVGRLANLARLYWYTVEFGLMNTPEGLRIYGAGIVSSRTESIFALDDPSPNRIGFDLERVMRTPYRIDDFQQAYFVIDSIQTLQEVTLRDFGALYERLAGARRHRYRRDRSRRYRDHLGHPGLCEGRRAAFSWRRADLSGRTGSARRDAPDNLVGREAAGEGRHDQDRGFQPWGRFSFAR
jgi:hypothetical protein